MKPTRCKYCEKTIHWFVKNGRWYPFEEVYFWNLHDCTINLGGEDVNS